MTDQWITIEQAAVSLGMSVRTVNRHIAAGKLQSRLQEGRREVLNDGNAGAGPAPGHHAQVFIGEQVAPADAAQYETVLALADTAADKAELAVSAYQTLAAAADERIRATRRVSAMAWSLVATLSVVAIVSVGWTSHRITRAAVENAHLREQVTTATTEADTANSECDDLRRALARAREDAAHAEGKLAAYTEPRQPQASTTRPTLTDRIASIFE